MTAANLDLKELLEKTADTDFLREMIGFTAQRLMELGSRNPHRSHPHGSRSADRLTHRNGYRGREWDTRAGTVELGIPKIRKGSYFPGFLEPRRMGEEGADGGHPGGLRARRPPPARSTTSCKRWRMTISEVQVSRLCGEIDDRVKTFLGRPLEGDWPYLWLDATYVKVRQAGRIISVAVIIAVGVNDDARREVLGMTVGASEAETFWTEFLRSLARRGLRGVKLVISDAHEGLKASIAKVLHATWQRCRVHTMRNLLAHAGRQRRGVAAAFIATAFAQTDAAAAKAQWRNVADQLRSKLPKLAAAMDEAEVDVLAYMDFPAARTKLHSTVRWNGSMARSSAAPMSLASSPPKRRSIAWSAPSCLSRTMNGRCSAPAT